MLENLKINSQKETFSNSLIARANSEVMLMDLATEKARQNGTNFDYEYSQLLESRDAILKNIVDDMQKFV